MLIAVCCMLSINSLIFNISNFAQFVLFKLHTSKVEWFYYVAVQAIINELTLQCYHFPENILSITYHAKIHNGGCNESNERNCLCNRHEMHPSHRRSTPRSILFVCRSTEFSLSELQTMR
jgi:hypothetical protein